MSKVKQLWEWHRSAYKVISFSAIWTIFALFAYSVGLHFFDFDGLFKFESYKPFYMILLLTVAVDIALDVNSKERVNSNTLVTLILVAIFFLISIVSNYLNDIIVYYFKDFNYQSALLYSFCLFYLYFVSILKSFTFEQGKEEYATEKSKLTLKNSLLK
jgi:hypothetical protein